MTNIYQTVYYVGITNSLERRTIEHNFKKDPHSFTAKYNICKLLYHEHFSNPDDAIQREKQLKKWRREKKITLIKTMSPTMEDLFLLYNQ